jgi:hypothetical protein
LTVLRIIKRKLARIGIGFIAMLWKGYSVVTSGFGDLIVVCTEA